MAKDTNSKGIWGVVQGEPQFDSWYFTVQNNNSLVKWPWVITQWENA